MSRDPGMNTLPSLEPEAMENLWKRIQMQKHIKRMMHNPDHSKSYNRKPPDHYGKQSMMEPISESALNYIPSNLMLELAKHKKDMRPLVNISRMNFGPGNSDFIIKLMKGHDKVKMTPRQLELAKPRVPNLYYMEARQQNHVPAKKIEKSTLKYSINDRILHLSKPREMHHEFQLDHTLAEIERVKRVSTKCRQRTHELAEPRIREMQWEKFPHPQPRKINMKRIEKLQEPKPLHDEFEIMRDFSELGTVTDAALNPQIPPQRWDDLAKPNSRPDIRKVMYREDAFWVDETAQKAYCSPRIAKLAEPITRN